MKTKPIYLYKPNTIEYYKDALKLIQLTLEAEVCINTRKKCCEELVKYTTELIKDTLKGKPLYFEVIFPKQKGTK